jgi:glycosyltransferase involved in cell wall biosynthesis
VIRVLNIISDTNIGGAGRCVLNFLKYYDREQFEVKVILPRNSLLKPEVERLDTPVIEVDGISDKSLDWGAIGTLRKVIRAERPQVVHTHGTMSGRIAGRLAGAKVVYTRHSVFPVSPKLSRQPGKFINGRINEFFADEIIAVAEAAKDNLTDSGIRPQRVTVLLNGVEPVTPLAGEELAQARERFRVAGGDFTVGILARLEEVKGHKYLIDAIRILREQGRPVKLIVAGVGACEAALKAQASALGLEDAVLFSGFVKDIPALLSVLDLQANASFGTEATSLALLEGMSLGLPAVVTNYGGNPGVIREGENGFLVPTHDAAALADRIARLMDDRTLYNRLSAGARELYQKKFTVQMYARNIEAVYRRAAGQSNHQ